MDKNVFLKYIEPLNEEQKENYEKYSKIRSKEIYYYISKFLCRYYKKTKVDYEMVNQWLRFDKDIKNVLYRFYAAFEEYFKSIILERLTFENNDFVLRNKEDKLKPNDEIVKVFNLGYEKVFKRKNILSFFKDKNIPGFDLPFETKNLIEINKLRNEIMHLSFILLPIYENRFNLKVLNNHLKKINKQIINLRNNLPDPWKGYLLKELENCLFYEEKTTKRKISRNLDLELMLDLFKREEK